MQDADLFLELAGIAGVFVGFAALISVRSGGASGAHEVAYIGWVVSTAIWVVIAALALTGNTAANERYLVVLALLKSCRN